MYGCWAAAGKGTPHGTATLDGATTWVAPAGVALLTALKGWGPGGPGAARRSSVNGGGGASAPCVENTGVAVVPGRSYLWVPGTAGVIGQPGVNPGTGIADGVTGTRATLTDALTLTVIWAGAAGNAGRGSQVQGTGDTGDSVGNVTAGNPGVAGVGGAAPLGGGVGGVRANPGGVGGTPGGGGGTGLSGTGQNGGLGGVARLILTW